jgi:hypothetical protein
MKQGFILIEVLIAAAIASIIGVALFTSLYQINRLSVVVDNYADVWTKAAIAHRQLEKDILGIFIPIAAQKIVEKKKENAPVGKEKKEQETPEQKTEQKKEPVKVVTHVFYGVNKEDVLYTLTFITNNPMQVYWGAKAGKAKPCIARVVYRLVKDKNEKKSYTLMRQEGYDLYFDAYKKGDTKDIRQYPMIDGIKQMSVSYGVEEKEEKDDKKENKAQAKKPQKIKYKILKEWKKEDKGEEQKKESKDGQEKEIELPAFILIKLNIWDMQKKKDVYFEFKIPLIAQGKPAPAPSEPAAQAPQGSAGAPAAPPIFPLPIPPSPRAQGTTAPMPSAVKVPQEQTIARGFVVPLPMLGEGAGAFTNLETGNVEFTDANKLLDQLKPQEAIHAS